MINLLFCPSVDKLPSSDVWSFLNCQPCTQTQQLQDEACSSITAPIFILFSSFTVLSCNLFHIRSAVLPQDSGEMMNFKNSIFCVHVAADNSSGVFQCCSEDLTQDQELLSPFKVL